MSPLRRAPDRLTIAWVVDSVERSEKAAEASGESSPGIQFVPGWDRFPWRRAGFSTRQGGRGSVYGAGEQNLGWTAEDDAAVVAHSRQRFIHAVTAGRPMSLTTLHQIHGNIVRDADAEPSPLMTPEGKATLRGDGLLSGRPGRLVGVITADCVPVLVADTRTRAVAAFHAGWRGTLARITEQGTEMLRLRFGSRPEDLVAAIGPAIRACCFAVGEEVRTGFEGEFRYADELFVTGEPAHSGSVPATMEEGIDAVRPRAQFHLNLHEANRRQLLDAGLSPERISTIAECTACSRLPDGRRKYFSHRAEHGVTGRMLSVIGAVPE